MHKRDARGCNQFARVAGAIERFETRCVRSEVKAKSGFVSRKGLKLIDRKKLRPIGGGYHLSLAIALLKP